MRTRTAIGDFKGVTYVFFNMEGERAEYPGESAHDEHPFIQFANASTFEELMASLDRLFEDYDAPCLYPYLGTRMNPDRTTDAKAVASIFQDSPSRRTVDRTKVSLDLWAFENSEPDHEEKKAIQQRVHDVIEMNKHGVKYGEYYSEKPEDNFWKPFLPLADVAQARHDLYLSCRLLAWLMDKIPFELAHSLGPSVGFGVPIEDRPALDLIDSDAETTIGEYYKKLSEREQNYGAKLYLVGKYLPMARMNDYYEINMRQDAGEYVRWAFNMMLSDTHKRMGVHYPMKPILGTYNATLLSAMWTYFAEAICKEPGAGAVTACLHCGKLIQQERVSRKFCSKSCSQLHKAAERAAERAAPAQ